MEALKSVSISLGVVFALCISMRSVSGHTMGLGSCPKVEPLKDFDMQKVSDNIFLFFQWHAQNM